MVHTGTGDDAAQTHSKGYRVGRLTHISELLHMCFFICMTFTEPHLEEPKRSDKIMSKFFPSSLFLHLAHLVQFLRIANNIFLGNEKV